MLSLWFCGHMHGEGDGWPRARGEHMRLCSQHSDASRARGDACNMSGGRPFLALRWQRSVWQLLEAGGELSHCYRRAVTA